MFGDPVTNPMGWKTTNWNDLFNTTTGKLDSNAMVENGIYPFFTCAKEVFAIDTYAFDCEALLLAGNNAAGIYDVKHYNGRFNAYQRTYVITLKDNRNSYFPFKYMLEQKLGRMRELSKGTNTRYLTMGILGDFDFMLPPLPLQNRFADFVRAADKSKFELRRTIDELEATYKAILRERLG
jgi:restriction endonuclease S subunit